MSRVIKFRAWDKLEKNMVNVCGIVWSNGKINDLNIGGKGCGVSYHDDADNFEPMQFTGLLDRNKREIYEGDIYHFGYKNDLRVMKWDEVSDFDEEYCGYGHTQITMGKAEVVGNIHENPELLKARDK